MKTNSLKLWCVAVGALLMFGCSNCYGTCDPHIPSPQPGSCPVPGIPEGHANGPCPGWPDQCESGTHCVSGTCLHCGNANETCCGNTDYCYQGICEQSDSSEDVCKTTCGSAGQPCCADNQCGSGLICEELSATCTSTQNPACSGNTAYYVGQYDSFGCAAITLIVNANSSSEAQTCANSVNTGLNKLAPSTTRPVPKQYVACPDSRFPPRTTVYFDAYSDADAARCLSSYCGNADCNNEWGECTPE